MRRSSIDREEKRVTGRNGSNQRWKNETEQLDTNDPNQRRLSGWLDRNAARG
jgi:hypothetical protein